MNKQEKKGKKALDYPCLEDQNQIKQITKQC